MNALVTNRRSGLLGAIMLISQMAFGESVCVREWIWGGCAQWETLSTLSEANGGGQPQQPQQPQQPPAMTHDEFVFKNNCRRPIQAAIHFKDLAGNWVTQGWYRIDPGKRTLVATSRNRIFYTYAETLENENTRLRWSSQDQHFPIRNDGNYGFQKNITNRAFASYTHTFSCDDIQKFHAIALAWGTEGGWVTRKANKVNDAQHLAMNACIAGRGVQCRIGAVVQPGNFFCLAIANGNGPLFAATRNNAQETENAAMASCVGQAQNCQLVHSICNN